MDLPPYTFSAVVVAVADDFLVTVVVRCLSREGVFGAGESGVIAPPIPRPLPAPEDALYSWPSAYRRRTSRDKGRRARVNESWYRSARVASASTIVVRVKQSKHGFANDNVEFASLMLYCPNLVNGRDTMIVT